MDFKCNVCGAQWDVRFFFVVVSSWRVLLWLLQLCCIFCLHKTNARCYGFEYYGLSLIIIILGNTYTFTNYGGVPRLWKGNCARMKSGPKWNSDPIFFWDIFLLPYGFEFLMKVLSNNALDLKEIYFIFDFAQYICK